LLHWLSPRAYEVRQFAGDPSAWHPLSYEPQRTAQEAAKLVLYAMVVIMAYARAHTRRKREVIPGKDLVPALIVLACVASLLVASFIHRTLDVDRMLGLLTAMKAPSTLLTTFVNPNHAAAFLVLGALSALGLAVAEPLPLRRRLFLATAVLNATFSALCFSRG